ncbi:DUF3231 family protein [Halobacillus aidingensis]|uniref:DUF3231 family protein n=1 Tax=Halobacillus aidingensis TaxID=240303 RepID=A0A1H0IT11_HALAD|nr:DUF3231 family protein [Halobacillus aidingensis]SDO34171.1 Protein of unknown function [Halobacillus aidingensis]
MTNKKIDLTASELGSLWTTYLYDSMSLQFVKYMYEKVRDEDVKPIIKKAVKISEQHVYKIESIFKKENLPIPYGFSEKDVELQAPDLYTDTFKLTFMLHMGRVGMVVHTGNLAVASRRDIQDFYGHALHQVQDLYRSASETALEKGLFLKRPYIPYPKQFSFVNDVGYLKGINPLKNHRILNAIEITHLSLNIETNQIGIMLISSFMQSSQSHQVSQYMKRGKEISKKHIDILSKTLMKDDIPSPISPNHAITDSTTPVFSDKLMMFQVSLLNSAGFGNYATAAAASQRSDLTLNYERLSAEVGQYAQDGAEIMIKNKWLEEPPAAPDRDQLGKGLKRK